MALVAFMALIVATIFGVIHLVRKNKADKTEQRKREIELEKKEIELQKLKNEIQSSKGKE